ncbi:hypothetical protein Ciccas_008052, partial [Cichlidogyrus casuarinus]
YEKSITNSIPKRNARKLKLKWALCLVTLIKINKSSLVALQNANLQNVKQKRSIFNVRQQSLHLTHSPLQPENEESQRSRPCLKAQYTLDVYQGEEITYITEPPASDWSRSFDDSQQMLSKQGTNESAAGASISTCDEAKKSRSPKQKSSFSKKDKKKGM